LAIATESVYEFHRVERRGVRITQFRVQPTIFNQEDIHIAPRRGFELGSAWSQRGICVHLFGPYHLNDCPVPSHSSCKIAISNGRTHHTVATSRAEGSLQEANTLSRIKLQSSVDRL
jgi:hypothetical protein